MSIQFRRTQTYATEGASVSDLRARIADLREELAGVTKACDAAREEKQPGYLFFLLRKKWTLTQHLFQAESRLLLVGSKERPEIPPDREP